MSDIIPEGILYGNLGIGSGTTNYNDLDNKPQINSVTLQGNKTASELGLVGTSDIPVTSVNGETGAVVLDGTEIEFSEGVSLNEKILAVEQEIPVIAYPVTSVNGETGAVVLDGTDIEYSSGVSVNSQIDTLMQYIPVYGNTASGAIATFDTSLALPLQDLQIAINAVQESGTPTPSSPKLISGFTGANITVNGKNFIDVSIGNLESGTINGSTGATEASNTRVRNTNFYPFPFDYLYEQGYKLTIPNGYKLAMRFYDKNGTYIPGTGWVIGFVPELADYFHNKGVCYAKFIFAKTDDSNITPSDIASVHYQLEVGTVASAYQAYNSTTYAITWQDEAGTVYGGSLDVTSGVLTVTWGSVDMGTLSWNNASGNLSSSSGIASDVKPPSANTQAFKGLCSCYEVAPRTGIADKQISVQTNGNIVISDTAIAGMTGEQVKAYVTGFILVYEVATPVTYQLTPTQISAIVGANNVFTDTNGDTSVMYACSLKDYIDGQ